MFSACAVIGADGVGSPAKTVSHKHKDKTKVIDIHCHLNIPAANAYMEPYMGEGIALTRFSSPETDKVSAGLFQRIGKKLNVIDERLDEMDSLGIDIQAISPSPAQYYYFAEPDVGRHAAQLVNDGITEAIAGYPDRFVGMGTVPLQDTNMAVTEMKRCVSDLGLRGIEISSNVDGRELSDPELLPFFAAAEELGVLLFLHPLGFTHGERLSRHYFNNLIGNPLESAIAVGHLVFDGVLDRYPGLRICVAHGGGYLPAYWGRMDHAYRAREDCRQHISRTPSDYMKQLYFDTLVFDKQQLDSLVQQWGADHLCLGTDYPFDMAEPDPAGFHAHLSESDREQIMYGTAASLLGMDVKA